MASTTLAIAAHSMAIRANTLRAALMVPRKTARDGTKVAVKVATKAAGTSRTTMTTANM